MKRILAIRARYRERQRQIAELVLQQNKRRFVWFQGALYWAGFGLVMRIVIELQQRVQQKPLFGPVLFCGLFGYLYGNWKWNDYERIVKR